MPSTEDVARESLLSPNQLTAAGDAPQGYQQLTKVTRYFDGLYYSINHAREARLARVLAPMFRRGGSKIHAHCAQLVAQRSIASVLDLGCGTGELLALLRQPGLASGTGVDSSIRSLEKARSSLARDERFRFEHADLTRCRALDEPHDAVLCLGVFDYYPLSAEFLARVFGCATELVAITVPAHSITSRRLLRVLWLALQGLRVHSYNRSSLKRLADRVSAPRWSIDVQYPVGQDNLWLVAHRKGQ
jgi:SAM-dependent methyltransferase